MASEATIAMTLIAKTSSFDRKMKRSSKRIDHMTNRTRVAATQLRRLQTAAKGVVGAYAGLAGIRIVARGFLAAGQRAEDFNQAMMSSLAIMGDVSQMMRQDMKQAAFEAASATKFASKEIAESFFFLASAGLKAEQQIAALPLVAKFAQAGMFDMRLATDLLTDAQSALGLTVEDAQKNLANMTRVADVLVRANTLANASVQQFSEALTKKAAAAMKFLNIEVEEGVAVLAAFADQGIKAGDAGTAFNIVTRELTTKSIQNAKAFREAGIRVFDYGGNLRNLADIIGDLETAMEHLAPRQRKMLLLQLGFQDKSSIFIQSLIGMSDKIREWQAALEDASGTTEEVAEKQLTKMAKAIAGLESAFTRLATTIDLFDELALVVRKVADATSLLNDAIGRDQKEAMKGATKGWLTWGNVVKGLLPKLNLVRLVVGDLALQEKRRLEVLSALIDVERKHKKAVKDSAEAAKKLKDENKIVFQRLGELNDRQRVAAELTLKNEEAQDKLIVKLQSQADMFGKSERAIALYKLELLDASTATKEYANQLFDQMDALKRSDEVLREASDAYKNFADVLAETRAEIEDFGKSDIEKTISKLVRAFKGDVLDKATINQIRIAAMALADLKQKASAFDTLKQKASNLFQSTRTPLEKYNEEIALLSKLASTIDPNTGKALIDTDTLNRGLKLAREHLRALKREARDDSFITGKREFVRRLVGNGDGIAANFAKRKGSPLFKQFGPTPPGGILQGGPPNLFGGGPGPIHPRLITADTSALAGSSAEAHLARIEALVRSGLTRAEKVRVN